MKKPIVLCLLAAVAASVALAVGTRRVPPTNSAAAIADKRRHLDEVVAELSAREVSHLSAAQRERREDTLEMLRAYSERGVFTRNTELPAYALPYFIDDYGTRCALAHVIDELGDRDLIERLAREENHTYVAQLTKDRELGIWLADNGLTIEEAAFIQAPSLEDDTGRGVPFVPPGVGNDETPVDTPDDDPGPIEPPSSGGPSAPPAPTTGRTRPRGGTDRGGWQIWWRVNRDAFVNLRARYHDAVRTTGNGKSRARRPNEALREATILPLLERLSRSPTELRASAIMSWALAVEPADAEPVVEATLQYLSNPKSRYRDLLVLALGIVRHEHGTAALREILHDTKQGRKLLARKSTIPERTRAFAAVAIGQSGEEAVIEDLLKTLTSGRGDRENLRSASIAALGELARNASEKARRRVAATLLGELERERWNDAVLATIPAALVMTGDERARSKLGKIVARFRGPREVRESAVLALGQMGMEIDRATVDALMASARRDPDLQTRRYAAIAIGEICARDVSADVPDKVVRKLFRFYTGTLDGHFKQPNAMEYHYLSAGLFARRFPDHRAAIVKRLTRVVLKSGKRDEQAAAALALGLSEDRGAAAALRRTFARAKDELLRGSSAEALGLLRDRTVKDRLLEIAIDDPSGAVRYQAALGLGYLADGTMVDPLVDALAKSRSAPARAALTRVLGEIGDRRAIGGLVKIAGDEHAKRQTRERALGALGLIARQTDRGWTFRIRRGYNFRLATPVMRQVMAIF